MVADTGVTNLKVDFLVVLVRNSSRRYDDRHAGLGRGERAAGLAEHTLGDSDHVVVGVGGQRGHARTRWRPAGKLVWLVDCEQQCARVVSEEQGVNRHQTQ